MRAFGLGLIAALAIAAPATAQRASQAAAVADRYVTQDTVPGIVIAVGHGDTAPAITAKGRIGAAPDSPAADQDSLWRVYSMTKPITGIAAMILIEQGKLRLDDPISKYIPAFANMQVLVDPAKGPESRPARGQITVRHLLTHTAGFEYVLPGKTGPLVNEYNRLGINPAQVSKVLEGQMRASRPASLEEFANKVASLPLLSDPGAKWSYSIGLDVLGRVIEVASGMPFDRFVDTRIFAPLKMQSSFWTVPQSEAGRLADNFAVLGGSRVVMDPARSSAYLNAPSFPYGGAGLVMSARDYDRFLHALLNGGELDGARILKRETVKLAMSNLLPAGADTTQLNANRAGGVALGFGAGGSVYLADAPGGPGKGTYGWGGAAGTIGWVDPVHKLRVTVMVNLFGELKLREDTTKAIIADLGEVRAPGFTGGTLDRADRVRHDPALLSAAIGDSRARLLVLHGLDPELDGSDRLVWTDLAVAAGELLFLGFDEGQPRFVAALPEGERPPATRSMALFGMLDRFSAQDAALYAAARSLVDWHARHGFCAVCATATVIFRAGWGRKCPTCQAEHFPRVDPVVIMLAELGDRVLLGRQPPWPPGRYSALAGFLEVGESIEGAVAREIEEEAGVKVRDVRYVASQPWPFPSSLMIACIGVAESEALTIDTNELEDARWFTRDQVARALAGDPEAGFIAPPSYAIAHTLLTAWVEGR